MLRDGANMTEVLIRRDGVRQKSLGNCCLRHIKVKWIHIVPHIEQDAPLAGFPNLVPDMTVLHNAVNIALETVGDDVAGPQQHQLLVQGAAGHPT